ncbi:hypothetical protein jhhlp_005429 [Lomentospora prolificans]|uniref:WD-like domain-containing protein n=1 Tax=Lomentospora prolificans TaxID=41688 RepID=A0A2N3N6S9_9PEZI|nr:hypothetical protein jhhlp_005429 [Lomentospora prolificans]
MIFLRNVIVAFAALTLGVHPAQGIPVEDSESDLVVLSSEVLLNGAVLTFHGYPPGDLAGRDLHRRQCGDRSLECNGSNSPSVNSCRQLIGSLRTNSAITVGPSPRSICLNQNGSQCCVSWSEVVSGLTQGDLIGAAETVLNQCVSARNNSGLVRNVSLRGVCTTQCLSNRATGCR